MGVWWHTSVILTLRQWRREDENFNVWLTDYLSLCPGLGEVLRNNVSWTWSSRWTTNSQGLQFKPAKTPPWLEEVLTGLHPGWGATGSWWLQGEGESGRLTIPCLVYPVMLGAGEERGGGVVLIPIGTWCAHYGSMFSFQVFLPHHSPFHDVPPHIWNH